MSIKIFYMFLHNKCRTNKSSKFILQGGISNENNYNDYKHYKHYKYNNFYR